MKKAESEADKQSKKKMFLNLDLKLLKFPRSIVLITDWDIKESLVQEEILGMKWTLMQQEEIITLNMKISLQFTNMKKETALDTRNFQRTFTISSRSSINMWPMPIKILIQREF